MRTLVLSLMLITTPAQAETNWSLPAWTKREIHFGYSVAPLRRFGIGVPSYNIELRYDRRRLGAILAMLGLQRSIDRAVATSAGRPPAAGAARSNADASSTIQQLASTLPDPAATPPAAADTPALDIVKIAPGGTSVIAGHAAPGEKVTVLENGKPFGSVTAGPEGDWVLSTEHSFASADPKIELKTGEFVQAREAAPAAVIAAAEPASPEAAAASPAEKLIDDLKDKVEAAREENNDRDTPSTTTPTSSPVEETASATVPSALQWPVVTDGPVRDTETKPASTPQQLAEASVAETRKSTETRQAEVIPIPMQFVYKEAKLTDSGRQAVSLLLEYVKLRKLDAVTLSGHADERGNAKANLKLSRARLVAIKDRLRKGGYGGRIELLPKGESEPFKGIDRAKLDPEDLMQLDRRVELRVSY